jgi:hypothetical protein
MYGLFHPCDRNYLNILEYMYEQKVSAASASQNDNSQSLWNEALKIGNEILIAYNKLYPRYDINTALMSLKLGKIASYLEKNAEAKGKSSLTLARCNKESDGLTPPPQILS